MKKAAIFLTALVLLILYPALVYAATGFRLGNEMLMDQYHYLIEGKKIGLVTNQTGITNDGKSIIDVLAGDRSTSLTALYAPEHGLDGTAKAGEYVQSYTHPELGIPVNSLYGATRMPTQDMLSNVDALVFDIQDIGARTYTYMSTLNYCMVAAKKYGKQIIVLDRPNPVGGVIVDGPVLEEGYETFVGVDNLPMAHGMTAGELARFFNRNIGADLKVVPMEGYNRTMTFEDTGLTWVPTSPNIPDLDSVRGYMATGLGEGTGIFQADKFKWIGGNGLDARQFANLLNRAGLPGVTFIPEQRGQAGGVRLNITDPYTFNPAKTGIYALTYAHSLTGFTVPKSGQTMVMFDKIMGTNKIGQYLQQGLTPQQIEAKNAAALSKFKEERQKYLIYNDSSITIKVEGQSISFDAAPYIDSNNRTMVPMRAISEALGASVDWDQTTRVITISKDGTVITLKISSTVASVNGTETSMDTTPVIKESRTMVPLRYAGEFLGAKIGWDQNTRTVTID